MKPIFRIGYLYIVCSVLCLTYAGLLMYQRHNPGRVAFVHAPATRSIAANEPQTLERMFSNPARIKSARLGIDLPVEATRISNGTWETSQNAVSYLASSPIPGSQGNSILYGHNWPGLLGKLTKAVPGDIIQVVDGHGSVSTFRIDTTAVLTPKDASVLNNTDDIRITIYTCTGFLDTKRFVATATLVSSLNTN